jgi:hypothetical protein
MFAKGILCKRVCQCISNLIICAYAYVEDLDESKSNELMEVMVANIDLFSLWTLLQETRKFKDNGACFKNFTVYNHCVHWT